MIDIGVVYYRIRSGANAMDATWYTSRQNAKQTGTGIARGDTSNGFPGHYTVTFHNPDGSDAGAFDLTINRTGPVYDLSYRKAGHLCFIAVGIETTDGLAAGYRRIDPYAGGKALKVPAILWRR